MLQQTRVAVVKDRYIDFLRRFPTLERLAAAKLPHVLAAWSGLGYYRRARALHAAARQLAQAGAGVPQAADELASLPGIGRYTAAAIASIAFNQRHAVVDGNVQRVLQRLLRVQERDLWRAAEGLLSPGRPGDFNQAMMELGATVCLPKSPLCGECPLLKWCRTRGAGKSQTHLPRRRKSIAYHLAIYKQAVFLVRRGNHLSLMPGLWELPQTRALADNPVLRLRHAITDTDYQVSVYRRRGANGSAGRWVRFSDIERLPLTGLTRKILRQSKFI